MVFLVIAFAKLGEAQFIEPQLISGAITNSSDVEIAYTNQGDRTSITFSALSELFQARTIFGDTEIENVSETPLTPSAASQLAPVSFLQMQLVYTEGQPGSRDIRLTNNVSGSFNPGVSIDPDPADDFAPDLTVSLDGTQAIAWQRGSDEIRLFVDRIGVQPVVGTGEAPQVVGRDNGTLLVAYRRGGDVFVREWSAGSYGAETLAADDTTAISDFSLAVSASGTVTIAVLSSVGVSVAQSMSGTTFSELDLVANAATDFVDLAASGEVVALATRVGSDIVTVELADSGDITRVVDAGVDAAIDVDPSGFLHVAYIQNGQVRYTNNGIPPVAAFSADVTQAILPFDVQFSDESTGIISEYLWDFGDGDQSIASSPQHNYSDVGPFTVSLTVRGPSGVDTVTFENLIQTTLPNNFYEMPRIPVYPGQFVQHPVYATHDDALNGFQTAINYNESEILFDEVSLDASIASVGGIPPEFVFLQALEGDPAELTVAIIVDVIPFDGRLIPPGAGQLFLTVNYQVPEDAPIGSEIVFDFEDQLGEPPLNNVFATTAGISIEPFFINGVAEVVETPVRDFLRGDANDDGSFNLGDGIYVLNFLFSGGPDFVCFDAADGNDDGVINLADGIFLLNFLFVPGRPPIPYPNPGRGLDPTPDTLDDCTQ